MEQRIEPFARRRLAKDDLRERRSIQNAGADALRPHARDFAQSVAVRGYDFSRNCIGVDNVRAQFGENRCDRALSRPDAAGQTNAHRRA